MKSVGKDGAEIAWMSMRKQEKKEAENWKEDVRKLPKRHAVFCERRGRE